MQKEQKNPVPVNRKRIQRVKQNWICCFLENQIDPTNTVTPTDFKIVGKPDYSLRVCNDRKNKIK